MLPPTIKLPNDQDTHALYTVTNHMNRLTAACRVRVPYCAYSTAKDALGAAQLRLLVRDVFGPRFKGSALGSVEFRH